MWLVSTSATSCCSETGFIYDHRNRLLAQTVDDLLLLKIQPRSDEKLIDRKQREIKGN